MLSQLTQDEYMALAHETIENNGSKEELKEKVKALYNQFMEECKTTGG